MKLVLVVEEAFVCGLKVKCISPKPEGGGGGGAISKSKDDDDEDEDEDNDKQIEQSSIGPFTISPISGTYSLNATQSIRGRRLDMKSFGNPNPSTQTGSISTQ
jgi:hypothetical protein